MSACPFPGSLYEARRCSLECVRFSIQPPFRRTETLSFAARSRQSNVRVIQPISGAYATSSWEAMKRRTV
jgi:hypothetical protein